MLIGKQPVLFDIMTCFSKKIRYSLAYHFFEKGKAIEIFLYSEALGFRTKLFKEIGCFWI